MPSPGHIPPIMRHCFAVPIGLFLLALLVRVVGIDFGLPHALARPDEETIIMKALRMEELGDANPRFFNYPGGMIYGAFATSKIMLGVARATGATNAANLNQFFIESPGLFHLALRIISATLGSLTVLFVWLAARTMFDRRTASLSALILALCYLHVRDSHFAVTDAPHVCIATAALWQIIGYLCRGGLRHLLAASALVGLAAGVKYSGAIMLLPLLVGLVSRRRIAGDTSPDSIGLARTRGGWLPRVARLVWPALAPAVVLFLAINPYIVLDWPTARGDIRWELFEAGRHVPPGSRVNGWIEHVRLSLGAGMGWPVLIAAAIGASQLAVRSPRDALLLLLVPIAVYLAAARDGRFFERYMDLALPFLAILAGWFIDQLARRVVGQRRTPGEATCGAGVSPLSLRAGVFAWSLVLLLLWPSIARIVAFDRLLGREDSRLVLRTWIEAYVNPTEPILWSGGFSALPNLYHHRPLRIIHATEKLGALDESAVLKHPWVILVEWPRAYYLDGDNSRERAALRPILASHYEWVEAIDAEKADLPASLFSPVDHFYLSFADPGLLARPGPGFSIYHRRIRTIASVTAVPD